MPLEGRDLLFSFLPINFYRRCASRRAYVKFRWKCNVSCARNWIQNNELKSGKKRYVKHEDKLRLQRPNAFILSRRELKKVSSFTINLFIFNSVKPVINWGCLVVMKCFVIENIGSMRFFLTKQKRITWPNNTKENFQEQWIFTLKIMEAKFP